MQTKPGKELSWGGGRRTGLGKGVAIRREKPKS